MNSAGYPPDGVKTLVFVEMGCRDLDGCREEQAPGELRPLGLKVMNWR